MFVFGQNVHLVARWLPTLESLLESTSLDCHPDYRVFMSGEPAPSPEQHVIPRGILENAIKITNEPPTGMHASLHAALHGFSQVRRKTRARWLETCVMIPIVLFFFIWTIYSKKMLGYNNNVSFCV